MFKIKIKGSGINSEKRSVSNISKKIFLCREIEAEEIKICNRKADRHFLDLDHGFHEKDICCENYNNTRNNRNNGGDNSGGDNGGGDNSGGDNGGGDNGGGDNGNGNYENTNG